MPQQHTEKEGNSASGSHVRCVQWVSCFEEEEDRIAVSLTEGSASHLVLLSGSSLLSGGAERVS